MELPPNRALSEKKTNPERGRRGPQKPTRGTTAVVHACDTTRLSASTQRLARNDFFVPFVCQYNKELTKAIVDN